MSSNKDVTYKVFLSTAVVVALLLFLYFLKSALPVLLLVFAGSVIAVLLHGISEIIARKIHMRRGAILAIVTICMLLVLGFIAYLAAPVLASQIKTLAEELPQLLKQLDNWFSQRWWGVPLARELESPIQMLSEQSEDGPKLISRVAGVFSTLLGALGAVLFIFLVALYLSAEPRLYINGLLRMTPKSKREHVRLILTKLSKILRWWMFGQAISMTVLASLTSFGLWILGMPYALVLGMLAAIMTFIPNLGPFLAFIPAVALAFSEGMFMTFKVSILYLIIQNLEGYFITPVVHRKIIEMPPVLILSLQIFLGYTIGIIGVFLAMPLVACSMVLVQVLYVEDILKDDMQSQP